MLTQPSQLIYFDLGLGNQKYQEVKIDFQLTAP